MSSWLRFFLYRRSTQTTITSKAAAKPKHPIGTHFHKKFVGYGIWEGCITSFDGEDYEVRYIEDNFVEFISPEDMDDIITKSDKYVQYKVKLETLQNQQYQQSAQKHNPSKRIRLPTDRYVPSPSMIKKERQTIITTVKQELSSTPTATSPTPTYRVGEHVWVFAGREMHSAKIKEILDSDMAKVQWTTMLTYANVAFSDIKPMFDNNSDGEVVSSRFSKRKRGQTNRFVPPPTKQEPNDMMTTSRKKIAIKRDTSHQFASSKNQYSPTKLGRKAAAKRAKSLVRPQKQYPLMKREPRQNQLPKQKSEEELHLEKEKEEDYKSLWNLYLEPKVRKNEELPSGMRIRQKTATCGLLRCKTSQFRKQLHKTIIRLEREGDHEKIHQMLKQMRDHDQRGAAGDGPKELMEEILDIPNADDDEVAFVDNITTSTCAKRESLVFDLEEEQPNKNNLNVGEEADDIVAANTSFEPIDPAIDSVEREKESNDDSNLLQDKVNDAPGKKVDDEFNSHELSVTGEKIVETEVKDSGASFAAAEANRGICSPSVVDSLDELEPKRFKRTEESIDLSTVSSLTFPGGESRVAIPQIPAVITIRRRANYYPKYTGAQISEDARKTSSTNAASSGSEDNRQTVSRAASSRKNEAADSGAAGCIDLSVTNSDRTIPYRSDQAKKSSDQVEIIDVDAEVQQVKRRQPPTMNEVIVLD